MTSVKEYLRRLFQPVQPLPAGSFALSNMEHIPPYRLHLRIDADGSGVLIVNAMTILHLNQSATEFAYYWLQKDSPEQAAKKFASRYRISTRDAQQDYLDLIDRIDTLIAMPDLDPEIYLDFERTAPHSKVTTAPYRLDCAITYQLRKPDAEFAPHDRVTKELVTDEWKEILEKAWTASIPHIVFTGGEPTLRSDLAELISHCESLGQVTGLITDGLAFANQEYLDKLLQTGLDHITILYDGDQEQFWDAIKNISAADIFLAVHITLDPSNAPGIDGIIEKLSSYDVKAISLSTIDPSIKQVMTHANDKAISLGISVVWDLPVPYSAFNPVTLETQEEAYPAAAGKAWLYVEPDGDVLPAQGINHPMGNILTDPWDEIWAKSTLT
jgi:organic radical activating enzyme